MPIVVSPRGRGWNLRSGCCGPPLRADGLEVRAPAISPRSDGVSRRLRQRGQKGYGIGVSQVVSNPSTCADLTGVDCGDSERDAVRAP